MKRILSFFFTICLLSAYGFTMAGGVFVPVISESFSRCRSSVPGGGYYSESFYFTDADNSDCPGWTSNSTYVSELAVKLNAKTKTGWITTPAIPLSSDKATVKIQFRAQTWTSDNIYLCVEIEGVENSVQKVDTDVSKNIVNRSEAPFELIFNEVPNGAKFKFYAEKRSDKLHRFFLSDVTILEERPEATESGVFTSAGYHLFSDLMAGNKSEERTIDVIGVGNGPIKIIPVENSDFTVTKSQGWDDEKGGRLVINFTPNSAGNKYEALKIIKGNDERKVYLSGKLKLYRPESLDPSDITTNSFIARWEPCLGVENIILYVYTKHEAELHSNNLMFTKYIEGKSNNRALEIYNGTGNNVDLNGWKLLMESNGSGGLTACEYKFPEIILASGKTFTICNAQYGDLRDIADRTIGYSDGGYANITTFTGDDAIGLFDPSGNLIDLLGYESYDCNDRVSGNWGQDVTYYRRSDSYNPHPKFYIDEWERHEMDYSDGYGTHIMGPIGMVREKFCTLELPGDATEALLENLPEETYYYSIEGVSNGIRTHFSTERKAIVSESGVNEISALEDLWALNLPFVEFKAVDGAVYTLDGMRLKQNNNKVVLPERGIYIVRCSGRSLKIAY